MFPGASTQIALSTEGQSATLAGVARGWTGLFARCRRAMAETLVLTRSPADGKIHNCRPPGEFASHRPRDGSPPPRNLRTPRRRFLYRSLDKSRPGKARTSGRLFAQRKRPFLQYLRPAHSAGEFFLCPGCPEYASRAAHPLRQKPPSARALGGDQLVLPPRAVPICLPGASPQFTLSSSILITLD